MARGSRFVQNLFTASKRARMLRAGMLVRCFRTSVPKTSYSSWTPLECRRTLVFVSWLQFDVPEA
jgi:hypothetical protein